MKSESVGGIFFATVSPKKVTFSHDTWKCYRSNHYLRIYKKSKFLYYIFKDESNDFFFGMNKQIWNKIIIRVWENSCWNLFKRPLRHFSNALDFLDENRFLIDDIPLYVFEIYFTRFLHSFVRPDHLVVSHNQFHRIGLFTREIFISKWNWTRRWVSNFTKMPDSAADKLIWTKFPLLLQWAFLLYRFMTAWVQVYTNKNCLASIDDEINFASMFDYNIELYSNQRGWERFFKNWYFVF